MNLKRIYAIFLRQFYLIRDNPTRFVQLFIWIVTDMVLWGFTSQYLTGVVSGFSFISVLLGAVLLFDFLIRVMQGVTMPFFEDVWSRNFLNIFASPLSILEYILGIVISSIGTSAMGLIVMLILATAIFGFSIFAYGLAIILFLGILLLSGIALGILGITIVLRFGPSAEWFVWPIPIIIEPFVGVLYPLSTLPHWMQYISYILPPSYVFEGVRAIIHGGTFSGYGLLIGFSLSLIYLLLAYRLFAFVQRRAIRTGLIARYSAESAS